MRADYHRLDRVALGSFGLTVTVLAASCGGSGGPTTPSPLPVASESASFRYHYAAAFGVSMDDVEREWLAML